MTENVYWVFELAINPGRFEDSKNLRLPGRQVIQKTDQDWTGHVETAAPEQGKPGVGLYLNRGLGRSCLLAP